MAFAKVESQPKVPASLDSPQLAACNHSVPALELCDAGQQLRGLTQSCEQALQLLPDGIGECAVERTEFSRVATIQLELHEQVQFNIRQHALLTPAALPCSIESVCSCYLYAVLHQLRTNFKLVGQFINGHSAIDPRTVSDALAVFIPIYPNTLSTVPKLSRASRTLSSVIINLGWSRSAITRLENR